MSTLRVYKVQLFVLPKVQGLTWMNLVSDRLNKVFKSNRIVSVIIKIAEHLIDLSISEWKAPVVQIKL